MISPYGNCVKEVKSEKEGYELEKLGFKPYIPLTQKENKSEAEKINVESNNKRKKTTKSANTKKCK